MKKFILSLFLLAGMVYAGFSQTCPNVEVFFNVGYNGGTEYTFNDVSYGLDGLQTYQWQVNNIVVGTGANLTYTFPASGMYNVCLYITENGCTYTPWCQTIPVAINGCPNVVVNFNSSNVGENYTFANTSTGTDGLQTYDWTVSNTSFGTTNPTQVGSGSSINYNFGVAGTYQVCLIVNEPYGCEYQQACQTITTTTTTCPSPPILPSITEVNAGGGQIDFFDYSPNETFTATTREWTFNGVYESTDQEYVAFPTGNDQVCLILTGAAGCVYDPVCVPVNANPCPDVIASDDANNTSGDTWELWDASSGEDANATFAWTINGVESDYYWVQNVTATLPIGTDWNVCLTVMEPNGCSYAPACIDINQSSTCNTANTGFNYVNTSGSNYTFTDASFGLDGTETYNWTVNGVTVSTASSFGYTFPSSGTYTVCQVVSEQGGTCVYPSFCETITINTACPPVIPSYTYVNTGNNTFVFTNTSTGTDGNQTYDWTANGITISNAASWSFTAPGAGSANVCLTITDGGCTYTPYCQTITVISCPSVTTNYVYANTSGTTYEFLDNSTGEDGNQTYEWTVNGTIVSGLSSLIYTFPGTGTYTVCLNVTDDGCSYTAYCKNITINACPSITTSYTYQNTSGNTYTFTNNSTGTNGTQTYAWTINGTEVSTASSFSYTFTSSGSYTVCLYVTEAGCAYNAYCQTINIASCPNVLVGFTDVNTSGNTYQFTDASTGENGSQSYNWTINGTTVSNASTFSYTFSGAGSYTVCEYLTEPGGCTYTPYCKTITIGSCPSITALYTYSNTGGNSYTFTNSSTGTNGTQTYVWTVNNSSVGTGSTLNYTFSGTGTYTVCLTVSEAGCTYPPYCQTITIASCPSVNVAYTYQNNGGNSYTFTDASTGENGSQTYNWTVNGTSEGTGRILNYTFSSAGSYSVCLNVTEPGGCTYTAYCQTITITSCPNVVVAYTDVNTGGNSYTFTDASTGETGTQTYSWTVNGTQVGTGNVLNYTFATSGTYSVCLNVNEPNGCTYSPYCKTFTIATCPSVVVAYTDVNTSGNSYTFTDASTGETGTQSYSWTVNGTQVGTGNVLNYTFSSSGTFSVCLNVTEPGGCTYHDYCKTFTIGSCPSVVAAYTFVNNGGNSYTFTNSSTGTNGNQTYQWTVNGTSVGTASTLNYTFSSAGSYSVCLNVGEPGCTYTPYCQTITITSCPNVSVSFTDVNTSGNAYTFTDASTGENGSQTYNWTVNGSSVGSASTLNYTFSSAGTYNVCLNVTEPGGCTYTQHCKTITIAGCPNVVVSYTAANTSGNAYTFTDASTGENGNQTYNWTINGTSVGTASTLNYNFTTAGSYNVCLNVTEPGGCSYTAYCQRYTITTCPNVTVYYHDVDNGNNSYTFTDSSQGEDGNQTYSWVINSAVVGASSTLNYTFGSAGSYSVCLNVTEPGGCTYQAYCKNITIVTCPNVVVNYNAFDNGNNTYTFTDASTGENGTQTYIWTVAGATVGTANTINYSFGATGTYSVCLSVAEPGCSYTPYCSNITINSNSTVIIVTDAASNVTSNSATLNGNVTSNGTTVTSLGFNWGLTPAYGNTIAATPGTTTGIVAISAALGGLLPNTTYYFQAIGSVNGAVIYGGQQQFTTSASSTLLTTDPASFISGTGATLNATVTSGSTILSSLSFNWGTTTSYGNTIAAVPSSASGNTSIAATLSGLLPNTTYYFQATGVATGNTIYANQQQFTTTPTGIPMINTNDIDVSIYPNPAKQQFIINTHANDTYTVDLYNMIGEKVLSQFISQPVTTMDVSTLANGIYNVVVRKDSAVKTYRLVVLNE